MGLYLAAGGTVTNTGTIIGIGDRFSYSGVGGITEHTYDGTGIIAAGPLTLVKSGEVYGIEAGVLLRAMCCSRRIMACARGACSSPRGGW